MGGPRRDASPKIAETRDGKGVIFVAYNGDIYPSGFAPYKLGNVRERNIVDIYRNHSVLKMIRDGRFRGRCGYCEFRDLCGGSRARAYVFSGDILGEDPACNYSPDKME
jgi:radical SAM protein with 4Fe4S-binding SPASM domain